MKTISDSLVKDLPCDGLAQENVLLHLQPDAFSAERQIPITNYGGGQCAGFAYVQRAIFYLMRIDPNLKSLTSEDITDIARMIKRLRPRRPDEMPDEMNGHAGKLDFSQSLLPIPFSVFSIPDAGNNQWSFANFLYLLPGNEQIIETIESQQIRRNLSLSSFSTSLNMYIQSKDLDRTLVMNEIESELARGRLPTLSLRAHQGINEHAVLAKKVTRISDSEKYITLYDSNYPRVEAELIFKNGQFYPGRSPYNTYTKGPIKVTIEERKSMREIERTLFNYYQDRCSADGAAR